MDSITVVSRCRCMPGKNDEFFSALEEFIGPSREEKGCISYDVYQDTQDPGNIIFHEVWKNQEGISYHISSSHFAAFMGKAGLLLEKIAGESPFMVTIASLFNPQSPPESPEVIVSTLCRALPGKNDEVRSSAPEMILNASSAEPGCSAYQLFQGTEQKDCFLLYEVWKGFSAIVEHMGTAHFAEFMGKAPSLFVPRKNGELFAVYICTPYA